MKRGVEVAKLRLIESALKYARMKTMLRYRDEKGVWVHVSGDDAKRMADSFAECLKLDALSLLAEMSVEE